MINITNQTEPTQRQTKQVKSQLNEPSWVSLYLEFRLNGLRHE